MKRLLVSCPEKLKAQRSQRTRRDRGGLRTCSLIGLVAIALITTGVSYSSGQDTTWQQIPIPPLPAFHPHQPKRIELKNGMIIFLQEDHELPLIDGTARIRGGSHNEPAAKVGLVRMYGEVWRTGGTKTQTGDQLDDFLEIRAAKVETGGDSDATSIGWSCLKGDLDDVFKVFIDLLRNPEFRDDKIDLAKKRMFDAISRRNDQIQNIAFREATKLAYGADNPYARVSQYATVSAVAREDLIDWHHKYVQPNNIILGITGDFDSAAMEAKLRAAFDSWPKGPAATRDEVTFHPAPPGYYLIPKEDVNQSNIQMVALGLKRDNPDYYAVSVFNEAFAGGFSSRLFNDIRTQRGLAYNVGGGIEAGFGHPGILQFLMGTKSQSTIESVQALDEDIDNIDKKPFTEDEIKRAQDAILNTFVFRLDSPDKILGERMTYEFYGYPADWLDRYPAEIKKVTAADVNRVAKKYLHREQLAVLVVGNTKEFDKPLSSLGAVKQIDITIPPAPGEKAAAEKGDADKPTASNADGKALAAKVVAAMGGEAKLSAIKAFTAKMTVTQKTPQGEFQIPAETTIIFPDRLHAEMKTPNGTLDFVVTPNSSFSSFPGMGVREIPPQQKEDLVEQIKRDPIFIASHFSSSDVFFRAQGTEKIGDVEARVVDVNAAGTAIRWYVDPQSGHILKETFDSVARGSAVRTETVFDNWSELGGITVPALRKTKQNGEDSSSSQYTALELNPTVDPKLFEKPANNAGTQP